MTSSDSEPINKNNAYAVSKRSQLRKTMRQERRDIKPGQQEQAATKLLEHILQDENFLAATKIAFYQAFDGEIDPAPAILAALDLGKRCFLPVIKPEDEALLFVDYTIDSALEKNHFGILEPNQYSSNTSPPEHMELIFMPLVAFDIRGNRLGMGKGYYDKNLAFLLRNDGNMSLSSINRPKLIGLAHECQRVERLERAEWDVPLDKIITDQAIYTTTS